ncbi:MAG TPA: response regulator transcription factor [Candidatus Limnocylindria bacterium]|nr:response regulator transcription factor [Candidatus Limnocylindria bacterium]
MKKLRILLVDDHEMLRRGLRAILTERADWEICGEASNGREAVEMAEKLRPDVIVMDLAMPELNGLEATRQIRRVLPRAEVLVLTFDESEALVQEVIAAGARGYVLKNDVSHVLVHAVESLAQHRPYFTSKAAEVLLDGFGRQKMQKMPTTGESPLTPREREIVQLVAEGKSTKEIAHLLGISAKTAENHRTNIMRKLKVKSATELVRYAIRNKMITP